MHSVHRHLQNRQRLLQYVDLRGLGQNAGREHQMLQLALAGRGLAGKVARFDLAVHRQLVPVQGHATALVLILGTVMQVFEDFTYHREFATDDGLSIVLEFSATVAGKQLKGIDMIRFDEHGKVVDFEVMVRPFSGLQALGAEMGKRLGHLLPEYKA